MNRSRVIKIILAVVLIFFSIVATVYITNTINQENLTTGTRADVYPGEGVRRTDPCGFVEISTQEIPSCRAVNAIDSEGKPLDTNLQPFETTRYETRFSFRNITDQTLEIEYRSLGFFCEEPWGQTQLQQEDGSFFPTCASNEQRVVDTISVPEGQSRSITVVTNSPYSQACGSFQNDVQILSINGDTSCALPVDPNGAGRTNVAAGGRCMTGLECNPAPENPPFLTINQPENVCVDTPVTVQATGGPGSQDPASLEYQVYAIKNDRTVFFEDQCPGEAIGQFCLLARSTAPSFEVPVRGLLTGNYQLFTQVVDSTETILCSNNTIDSFPVKCARSCL